MYVYMHSCIIYYIAVIHFRTLYCILFHQEYFLAHIAHQVGISDHLGTLLLTAKKQFNALLVSLLLNKKGNIFYLWSKILFKHVENCRKCVKKRCQHVLVARHAMQWELWYIPKICRIIFISAMCMHFTMRMR